MPTTPDLPDPAPLHHAAREARLVARHLPDAVLLWEDDLHTLTESTPTKGKVLERLRGCPVAHFACHGKADPSDPTRSRLLLHDHAKSPFTIASLTQEISSVPAGLAYLSACRTAANLAIDFVDEAIHLANAFQLVGYPHVVGTLWEIDDAIAADIADDFYAALCATEQRVNLAIAAEALHRSLRATRDNGLRARPSLWAAFVHVGA